MANQQNNLLNSEEVDRLVILVEEATRATKETPRHFIEPARGTLDRAKAHRHHIVFGRRGSGKTSLLRKASADLTLGRVPIAFIDLEAFKGHTYPDVLLSVLIETLDAFDSWLGTAGTHASTKVSFWKRFWGGAPKRPPLDKKKLDQVRGALESEVKALKDLLHSEDDAELVEQVGTSVRSGQRVTDSATARSSGTLSAPGGKVEAGVDAKIEAERTNGSEQKIETTEKSKRSKIAFLHRKIIDFQKIFDSMVDLADGDAFIFLDDLYHLRKGDQAYVLDYFHRIVKGRSVWLKVGTIRHRTDWYHHGNPPIGMKLGDDCDDIDLDITLEKYEIAKRFLLQILDQIIQEAGIKGHQVLLADGGIERLVLASGGVARDFLTIFRRAIDVARERGKTHRGERINAEDVNVAAGEHDRAKRDELRRDTLGERERLEQALLGIQGFCVGNKVNCFLVEQDTGGVENALLGELVDLRFVHVVDSRTSVRDRPGKLYTVYMLDISQYTGERLRRDLEIIAFWKRSELDKIRRSKYVLSPNQLVGAP
jgi:Cdc6-like AAA superfamily ATPase